MWLCMKFNNSSSQLQASQRGRTGAAFQHTGQGLFESCHFLPVITQIEKKKTSNLDGICSTGFSGDARTMHF